MTVVTIDKRARQDLRGIWRYTENTWDARQANKYLAAIDSAISQLAMGNNRAARCDSIKADYSRIKSGSHFVFVKAVGDEIRIVRVLHESMDFAAHLE